MAPVKLLSLTEQLTPSGGVINTIELGVADRAAVSFLREGEGDASKAICSRFAASVPQRRCTEGKLEG